MKFKQFMSFMCVVLFTMFALCSCQQKNIYINKEQSYFSNFKIEDGKVYIYCSLLIENPTGFERTIAIKASFENDVSNGLLKEPIIDGYLVEENKKTFRLEKGKNQLDVVFIGQHAGGEQKQDRRLPNIKIVEIE